MLGAFHTVGIRVVAWGCTLTATLPAALPARVKYIVVHSEVDAGAAFPLVVLLKWNKQSIGGTGIEFWPIVGVVASCLRFAGFNRGAIFIIFLRSVVAIVPGDIGVSVSGVAPVWCSRLEDDALFWYTLESAGGVTLQLGHTYCIPVNFC